MEDAATTLAPSDSLTAAGTISFTDADLSDTHTASFVAAASNTTALGTFSLDPVSEAVNAANGSVQWHYALNNAAAQYLAEGQSVAESFVVTVNDGHGSTATQTVTVTITGTNDAASITSGNQSGAVVEDAPATPSPSDSLSASGTISFNDVDLSDGHTASFAAAASNTTTLGTFSLDPVSEAANAANGSVQWHYALNNAAAQYLDEGQSVAETFLVTVNDGHGSIATQSVTITLTGTNDAPVAVADTNSGSEDTTITGTVATNDSDVDDGDIDVLLEQVGREAVPQGVQRDALVDLRHLGGAVDGSRRRVEFISSFIDPKMRDQRKPPDPSASPCRRQAQVEETRRVLRVCDAADRAIDNQLSRSSGGALPRK
ncbi:VCBS repeat-containing protein [Bradyrhizobium sp. Rc2d]|nr:VCBS repeat-containing protein [Bradyrhizobium sp. Rc2d]